MALYHFHVDQVKRTEGRSAVAGAAYRAGEKIENLWDGEVHDYTKKGGVVHTEIMLPPHAPERYSDRATLWNELELFEKRADAQLAYSFDMALQNEFTMEENMELAKEFVKRFFVSDGMIADIAIHLPDEEEGGIPNPHIHVLAPIRPLNEDGTWGAKQHRVYHLDENGQRFKNEKGQWVFDAIPTTNWGRPETLEMWREEWANLVNVKFAEKNLDCRIDHRSYVDQGLDLLPTVHEGPKVCKMEKRGIRTEKGEWNRWIKKTNQMLRSLRATISALREWIAEVKEMMAEPKEIYLSDLLRDSLNMRNETAMTYTRGKQKAKRGNAKRFMEITSFLLEKKIYTMSDFETHFSSVTEKVDALTTSMKTKHTRMKELQQLLELAATYKELKPFADELKKDKYKFKKAKEKYQQEHESELRRFQMIRRKLKEAGIETYPFPQKAWEKELAQLSSEYEDSRLKYQPYKTELDMLYRIKVDVNQALRERYPQLKEQQKESER